MEKQKAIEIPASERYDSPYSGEQETDILQHAEKLKDQTAASDGDTVQVYDVDGNPHKVAKSELLKKSTLALPNLSDISKFVAVNAKGDAVGLMTKEQVAQVLGELITHPFAYRKAVDISTDANDITNTGFYAVYCWEEDIASKHYPIQLGHLIVFQDGQGGSISQFAISSEGYAYTRMKWGDRSWSDWR